MTEEPDCPLISSFFTRQGVIAIAGLAFFTFTYVRKLQGYETRDLRTFAADVSKQGFQQGFGGVLMAAVGVHLAHEGGFDALAWYGAEYPFEIIITTICTRLFRVLSERMARQCHDPAKYPPDLWLPLLNMGRYGPSAQEPFRCDWYLMQMLQAVLLIGVPARLIAVGFIIVSTSLPPAISPVRLVAGAYFDAPMGCGARTALTLYVVPLLGDAVQFVIIDLIQKAKGAADSDREALTAH